MDYSYEAQKSHIFTEDGVDMLFRVEKNMRQHCDKSGAVGFIQATEGITGDSWDQMACVDYLVKIGKFTCIHTGGTVQQRIYKAT